MPLSQIRRCGLFLKEIPRQERHVCRAFRQPPHEIRIPLAPERDIEANVIALLRQLELKITAYSIQHLKFEMLFGNVL